jgi:transcriptional regulator with XRE-family HTH domain
LDAAVAFGRVLRRLRDEAGFTQEQLGFEADLRRTYVSILELGQQQPTLTTILKLAKALRRSAQELVGLVEAEMHQGRRRR